ncbi:AMP-binding protein [Actinomarinicola tropica]|uniref:AMP-binding protein n=1 Tax=Actinomarinicola tropica TaxID=2789776 RepID=A0A5Q2RKS7_9ACTN|nr:AMP-binding protein [Actinomarinicola tropica]QGG95026.1 AMP-binding protein [Actinomarinicola tropica]
MTTPAPWTHHLPSGTDPDAVDLLARGTLPRAWVALWREDAERAALRDVDGTWLSRGDLLGRSEQTARRLAGAGLRRGDRVLLSGGPSADLVVAHVAALRLGLVVVPVNDAYTPRELQVLLEDSGARGAVLGSAPMREQAAAAGLPVVAGVDVDLPDGPEVRLDVAGPDDPALLPYTSGTTGRPKGALLTHANILASVEALLLAWRWSEDDRLVLALPLFHMHGLGVGVHGTLAAGASAVLLPRFDPEDVLTEAADATMFFGVPTMYSRLVEAPGAERLASLRLCVSGSAPLSATLHARIADRCGQRVLERYGMTETVMLVSNPYDGERRPGTVGIPLPGVELRLAPGTSEIEVRGPNVFGGYDARPEANATSFTPDGWFRTGDVGAVDDAGHVAIVGRAKELIISGGYNVYPREIEDLIRAQPGVRDVAVVGTPSEEWGEVVTAVVEAPPDVDADAVVAAVAADLVAYKRPRLVRRVDALPRNAMGKVVRAAIDTTG